MCESSNRLCSLRTEPIKFEIHIHIISRLVNRTTFAEKLRLRLMAAAGRSSGSGAVVRVVLEIVVVHLDAAVRSAGMLIIAMSIASKVREGGRLWRRNRLRHKRRHLVVHWLALVQRRCRRRSDAPQLLRRIIESTVGFIVVVRIEPESFAAVVGEAAE